MTVPRFLMCPPEHFEVVYEINPWMSVRRRVDPVKARDQWKKYYDLLTRELGIQVELLEPAAGLPDMVFTANAGLVSGNLFIRSNFRHEERRGEETYFEKWFRRQGYKLKGVDKAFFFEGEGDALWLGDELFAGYHFRSDLEAYEQISDYLKKPFTALELDDKRFYHLDTCFAPLSGTAALVYPGAFSQYARIALEEMVPDPVEVPEAEAVRFACNAVVAGRHIILPEGCPQTAEALEKRGYHVYALDFSEFIKAGGAAKCLVLRLE